MKLQLTATQVPNVDQTPVAVGRPARDGGVVAGAVFQTVFAGQGPEPTELTGGEPSPAEPEAPQVDDPEVSQVEIQGIAVTEYPSLAMRGDGAAQATGLGSEERRSDRSDRVAPVESSGGKARVEPMLPLELSPGDSTMAHALTVKPREGDFGSGQPSAGLRVTAKAQLVPISAPDTGGLEATGIDEKTVDDAPPDQNVARTTQFGGHRSAIARYTAGGQGSGHSLAGNASVLPSTRLEGEAPPERPVRANGSAAAAPPAATNEIRLATGSAAAVEAQTEKPVVDLAVRGSARESVSVVGAPLAQTSEVGIQAMRPDATQAGSARGEPPAQQTPRANSSQMRQAKMSAEDRAHGATATRLPSQAHVVLPVDSKVSSSDGPRREFSGVRDERLEAAPQPVRDSQNPHLRMAPQLGAVTMTSQVKYMPAQGQDDGNTPASLLSVSGIGDTQRPGAELVLADIGATPAVSSSSNASTVPNRPEMARAVAVQIAEVITSTHQRAIELKLHPEELGRVSMTLSQEGGGLHIAMTVDRSETLDLMRRHIDGLGEELRRLGYNSVDFTFDGGGAGTGRSDQGGAMANLPDTAENEEPPHALTLEETSGPDRSETRIDSGRVDIRL